MWFFAILPYFHWFESLSAARILLLIGVPAQHVPRVHVLIVTFYMYLMTVPPAFMQRIVYKSGAGLP